MKKFKLLTLLLGCGFILSSCSGAEGPAGPIGPQGPQGETGQPGANGQNGTDGEDGKSAYEIYCEAHPEYTGSEEEWLDDLVNGELGNKEMHIVTFDSNGGTAVEPQEVLHGEKATKPASPTNGDLEFLGWNYQGEPWSFAGYVVTEDMTLVAQWGDSYVSQLDKAIDSAEESIGGVYYTNNYGETEPTKATKYEHGMDANGEIFMTYGPNPSTKLMASNYYAYDANGNMYGYSVCEGSPDKYVQKINSVQASNFKGPMSWYFNNATKNSAVEVLEVVKMAYVANSNNVLTLTEDNLYVEYAYENYGSTNLAQITFEMEFDGDNLSAFQFTFRQYYSYQMTYDAEYERWYVNDGVGAASPTIHRFVLEHGYPTLMLPYNVDNGDFNYKSFDLKTAEGELLPNELTIEVGEKLSYSVANASPRQASYQFDTLKVEKAVGAAGDVNASFNTYSGLLDITGSVVGETSLAIKTNNVTKSININVVPTQPSAIRFANYSYQSWNSKYSSAVMGTPTVEIYAGKETGILGPQITPLLADQSHTFVASSTDITVEPLDNTIVSNLDIGNYNYKDVNFQAYTITSNVPGTYTVTATSTANPSITADLTVVVKATPTVEDITSKEYWHYYSSYSSLQKNIYLTFTPDATDASTGSLVLTEYLTNQYNNELQGEEKAIVNNFDYEYDAATFTFTLSQESVASTISLVVTDDFSGIVVKDSNSTEPSIMNNFTLKEYSVMPYFKGEWYLGSEFDYASMMIYEDGRINFASGAVSANATIEENVDGTYTLVLPSDKLAAMATAIGVDSITSLVMKADFSEITMTYVSGGTTSTTAFTK